MRVDKNIKKGGVAEEKFKEWLDKHEIPYMYINQNPKSFSESFKNQFKGKRPDFIILIPNFGIIFVDVKNRTLNKKYKNFPIDCNETEKYSSFQRKFNMHIWYVISNEHYGYENWLWIPVSKVLELGIKEKVSSKSGDEFFPIPLDEFIQISQNDSLERLFSKLF